MVINLFDLDNGVLVPSLHCYSLKSLKAVQEKFPKDYLKVYKYIFYKTCSDPKLNPFFNMIEEDKEDLIVKESQIDFSLDNPIITEALDTCAKLYDTPTKRAYEGMKTMMDKLALFFKSQALTTGRDGSLTAMTQAAGKYNELRESFKGVEKDYMEEIAQTRGKSFVAYDMH